jgi:hypothetical protein
MVVDPETGIKKINRIRLNGGTSRTDAIKAILGRFEQDSGITRDASGKIIGRDINRLLRLLKCPKAPIQLRFSSTTPPTGSRLVIGSVGKSGRVQSFLLERTGLYTKSETMNSTPWKFHS